MSLPVIAFTEEDLEKLRRASEAMEGAITQIKQMNEARNVALEAFKIMEQCLLEVRHAQEAGPGWYTGGEPRMYRQVSTWITKANEAIAVGKKALGS